MKKFLIILMAFCLAFSLVACGGNGNGEKEGKEEETTLDVKDTTDKVEDTTDEIVDDGKATYTVKVCDEAGNPIAGAMVQICKDTCFPGMTDENGVATFNVLEDEYKVSFLALPEGYTYAYETTEFYFEDGSNDITLTLKAAE